MSEMLERLASAMQKSMDEQAATGVVRVHKLARAVLRALREPTEEMLEAGREAAFHGDGLDGAFQTMIDAALGEPE